MNAEALLPLRGSIVLCVLLGVLVFSWLTWRGFSSRRQHREAPVPTINKQPVAIANLTITQITVTLQLNINIWVPTGVTQHVIEHEEGHRQVSEYYYQTADKLA